MAGVAINWCSATRQLLRWSFKQPPIPLSGVLYEQGPFSKIKNCSVELLWKGTLDWWLIGSQTYKHQETNWLRKSAQPLLYIYHCGASLSTFYAESLCRVHTVMESDSAPSTLSLSHNLLEGIVVAPARGHCCHPCERALLSPPAREHCCCLCERALLSPPA